MRQFYNCDKNWHKTLWLKPNIVNKRTLHHHTNSTTDFMALAFHLYCSAAAQGWFDTFCLRWPARPHGIVWHTRLLNKSGIFDFWLKYIENMLMLQGKSITNISFQVEVTPIGGLTLNDTKNACLNNMSCDLFVRCRFSLMPSQCDQHWLSVNHGSDFCVSVFMALWRVACIFNKSCSCHISVFKSIAMKPNQHFYIVFILHEDLAKKEKKTFECAIVVAVAVVITFS